MRRRGVRLILLGMSQGLYLGKTYDPTDGKLGERLELDPADLLTHGLVVGMTGSGKTGLAIALIEETLLQGVPVLAIDPKGDLGNLLLLFDDLKAASFRPWVDEEAARRDGKTVDDAAAEAATTWQKGLSDWGLSGADVAKLHAARDAVIYTPGSTAGVPLNVLQSLEAPDVPFDSAPEDLRDEIAGIVSGILGLLRLDTDPLQSKEFILLSNIIEHAWRSGTDLTLEALIAAVADPPFDKIGALPVESVYKRKERQSLMMSLNNLLASPTFEVWRQGEPLDIAKMLGAGGKPRLSVVYTAHLSEEERFFVTALLLDKVKTWMRRQGGTSELRALVYMDEIFGYFPPHPANPPTKRPLLTLLKQARAQGIGIVLATQNPVDIDYKGLSNMGTWMVGKLQTDQDRARLREGLLGAGVSAATLEKQLDATKKRVFFLHDVHRPAPCLLHSRFALSYLRGPITREEIGQLMGPYKAQAPAAAAPRNAAATATTGGASTAAAAATTAQVGKGGSMSSGGMPVLPAPFKNNYFAKYKGEVADPYVLVKYAARYKGLPETISVKAYPMSGASAMEMIESEPIDVDEGQVASAPPAGLRYSDLPGYVGEGGARGVEKALRDRLPDKLAVTLFVDPVTKTQSTPGEDREAFAKRIEGAGGGAKAEQLKDKLEKKKMDLAAKQQELSGRKSEKWVALGSALLSNIGLLTGKKRTVSVSGASTVFSKNRMENTAEAKIEQLQAEIAGLEADLAQLSGVDPARFEEKVVAPAKTDVKLLRYDVLWVY